MRAKRIRALASIVGVVCALAFAAVYTYRDFQRPQETTIHWIFPTELGIALEAAEDFDIYQSSYALFESGALVGTVEYFSEYEDFDVFLKDTSCSVHIVVLGDNSCSIILYASKGATNFYLELEGERGSNIPNWPQWANSMGVDYMIDSAEWEGSIYTTHYVLSDDFKWMSLFFVLLLGGGFFYLAGCALGYIVLENYI